MQEPLDCVVRGRSLTTITTAPLEISRSALVTSPPAVTLAGGRVGEGKATTRAVLLAAAITAVSSKVRCLLKDFRRCST